MLLAGGCQNPESLIQQGNIFYLNGEVGNAALSYEQAREYPSVRAVADYNLGRILLEHGDANRAVGYLQEGEGPLVKVFRARAYRTLKNPDKARESLQGASLDDPDVALEWALLAAEESDWERAMELLTLVKKSPLHWEEATLEASDVKARLGDVAGAARELEILLSARPQRTDVNYRLGRYHVEAGQYARADRHLRKAVELDPASAPAVLWLGRAVEGQGKMQEARKIYTELVNRLPPENPVAAEAEKRLRLIGGENS